MKALLITAALIVPTAAMAQSNYGYGTSSRPYGTGSNSNSHYVQPHVQRDGDYVSGHYRTNPDSSRSNNYGATGNYNPYTGATGGSRPRY